MVKTVVEGSPQPYGLTVFRDSVYWADWKTGTIERADKDTGEYSQGGSGNGTII